MPEPADEKNWAVQLARMEAKLDVAIAQHGTQLNDLERRVGGIEAELKEHDTRITANALTIAETRAAGLQVADAVNRLRADLLQRIDDVRPKNIHAWAGVVVSVIAAVIALVAVLTR